MYQSDTEMMFPNRVIPNLRNMRSGKAWRELVDQVAQQPDGHDQTLAFGLMMIRLGGCLSCHADSYRAMRGCTACSQQTVQRFKESDEGLIKLYKKAQKDVEAFHKHGTLAEA